MERLTGWANAVVIQWSDKTLDVFALKAILTHRSKTSPLVLWISTIPIFWNRGYRPIFPSLEQVSVFSHYFVFVMKKSQDYFA
jgi:hypothetical protein